MFNLKLSEKWSNRVIAIYLLGTLYIRFLVEPKLEGHTLVSVAVGLLALLFLWAMIKSGFLNPSFWGSPQNG